MAGTKETSIRSYNFYTSGALAGAGATGTYAENQIEFVDVDDQTPFLSHSILIVNDGAAAIDFRFSADLGGGASHGQVGASEQLQLDFKRARRIYLSGTVAGSSFRLWAW
jgi:hypothetical protein